MLPRVRPFYDDAKAQLKATNHFGVLGETLNQAECTRLDYVGAHCALLKRLKQLAPGLGLGRDRCFPSDRPRWTPLKDLTGLELCQAWTVLLNAGHLFGTFATERGLLFHLDKDLEARRTFIDECSAFDHTDGNELRPWLEGRLDRPRLHDFFYLLALWRLREKGVSQLPPDERRRAQLLIDAFLRPPQRVAGFVDLFRRTRQLVYLELHNKIANRGLQIDSATDQGLMELFPKDVLADDQWYSRGRWSVLAAIDRYDAASLFASATAASSVLKHVEHFKSWLQERVVTTPHFIDALFQKPTDWREPPAERYEHYGTLHLVSGLDWMSEVRLWLRDDAAEDPWTHANFLVTPGPLDDVLQVDLYRTEAGLPVRALRQAIVQLTRAFSVPPSAASRALWHSTAELAMRAFSTCLKEGYALRITPASAAGDHVGYASAGASYEFVRGLVKRFISRCHDLQRKDELRQTLMVADSLQHWRSPAILLLGKVELLAPDLSTVTDIDGIFGVFVDDVLRWYVIETKAAARGGGKAQLKRGVMSHVAVACGEVRERKVGQNKTWHFEMRSPDSLR